VGESLRHALDDALRVNDRDNYLKYSVSALKAAR
jgi:hypothetical protein